MVRVDRQDVMRHFGLSDPRCGFTASFPAPDHVETLQNLEDELRVLGGSTPETANAALRLAPAVSAALHAET
jgi:hypothetical protein